MVVVLLLLVDTHIIPLLQVVHLQILLQIYLYNISSSLVVVEEVETKEVVLEVLEVIEQGLQHYQLEIILLQSVVEVETVVMVIVDMVVMVETLALIV